MVQQKSFYDLEDICPEVGQRVKAIRLKSVRGAFIEPHYLDARRRGAVGTITSYVPGHGGDYWFVSHSDDSIAAYGTKELCLVHYPTAFVRKVQAAFPDWLDLHQALGLGSEMVGRYLDESSSTAIEATEILRYINERQTRLLYEEARRRIQLRKLYGEWQKVWKKMGVQ